jgi:hypothetical protein
MAIGVCGTPVHAHLRLAGCGHTDDHVRCLIVRKRSGQVPGFNPAVGLVYQVSRAWPVRLRRLSLRRLDAHQCSEHKRKPKDSTLGAHVRNPDSWRTRGELQGAPADGALISRGPERAS